MTSTERTQLKEQVLAAAENAIAELGFFGVSLRGIAARAGLEPGAVHNLFGDKRTLLLAAEARLRARRKAEGVSPAPCAQDPQG